MSKIKICKWKTLVSECEQLYAIGVMQEDSTLSFTVEDGQDKKYLFEIKNPAAYRIYDEEYFSNYWFKGDGKTRWIFLVKGANWEHLSDTVFEIYLPNYKHYVIGTWSLCLEVLSSTEPSVQRIKNE